MGRMGVTGLGAVLALMVAGAPAEAALPQGNLLANPGAEAGSGSASGYDVFTLPGWTTSSLGSPRLTAVRYGAPAFPTVAQGAALGGGNNFFAGGPTGPGEQDSAVISQTVLLPPEAEADVAASGVRMVLSGCLGGYADQDDRAALYAGASGQGQPVAVASVGGPLASDRGGSTKLVPVSRTTTLPTTVRRFDVEVSFRRTSGNGTYNDAYADNISLRLIGPGQPVPAPDCPPASVGGTPNTTPGGPGGPGGGGSTGSPTGTNTAAGLTRVGKTLKLKGRYGYLKVRCRLRDSACRGRVTLRRKGRKLGSSRYSLAASKTKTLKVKLSRRTAKSFKSLSRRKLRKVKFSVSATVGAQTTRFNLAARR